MCKYTEIQITVKDKNDTVKVEAASREQVILAWKGEYGEEDRVAFSLSEKNRFYIIRADDTMDEAFIYGAGNELVYEVPFAEGKTSCGPRSFTGERRYLTMRHARGYEIKSCRNLAKNVMGQYRGQECYPHAYANVEARGETVFTARSAIDSVTVNLSHGK